MSILVKSKRFDFAPLGEVIRQRREELHLSQSELAERAGLHRTYISDIERGARNFSLGTLAQLAAALNTEAWCMLQKAAVEHLENTQSEQADEHRELALASGT
jgi:transcriptional regulator with XRE-family HTH domain